MAGGVPDDTVGTAPFPPPAWRGPGGGPDPRGAVSVARVRFLDRAECAAAPMVSGPCDRPCHGP
ncbi:hypothetical protein GCM10027294_49450 [Marinactinospora endophytica]